MKKEEDGKFFSIFEKFREQKGQCFLFSAAAASFQLTAADVFPHGLGHHGKRKPEMVFKRILKTACFNIFVTAINNQNIIENYNCK